MIKQLLDRYDGKKLQSGVVITSSVAGQIEICGMSTYSTTKKFVTHLAKCLNYEFHGKVEVLSFNPGVVTTKMTKQLTGGTKKISKTNMRVISEERAADGAF